MPRFHCLGGPVYCAEVKSVVMDSDGLVVQDSAKRRGSHLLSLYSGRPEAKYPFAGMRLGVRLLMKLRAD